MCRGYGSYGDETATAAPLAWSEVRAWSRDKCHTGHEYIVAQFRSRPPWPSVLLSGRRRRSIVSIRECGLTDRNSLCRLTWPPAGVPPRVDIPKPELYRPPAPSPEPWQAPW